MAKIEYDDKIFDSMEEIEVYQWCEEAKQAGLIFSFTYQPPSYTLSTKQTYYVSKQLKTKIKTVEKTLLQPHVYTADFMILFETDYLPDFLHCYQIGDTSSEVIIDVKGKFNMNEGDRVLSINQKWVYEKHGIYVNKVVPEKLFNATFVPEKVRWTPKTGKLRKKYIGCKTISEYMEGV